MSGSAEDSQGRRQRLNDELVEVVKHMGQIGPRINEVARLSRQYKESVRYRYHKFFLNKGIMIQATPDFSKLGFARLIVFAKLKAELEDRAASVFTTLSETCYVRSYARTLLTHMYIIQVAVPAGLKRECEASLKKLREEGLFTELRILEFEELRNPPMMAEFYNFITERWSFPWPDSSLGEPRLAYTRRGDAEKYDRIDLLVLKELEIDASRTLVQIAEKVGVPFKTVQSHYMNHIEGRHLVRAYRVVWPESRYDSLRGKAVSRKDRYVEVTILLKGGTAMENAELRTLLNRLPFLWYEAAGPDYWAELYLPNEGYVRFLQYLDDFACSVGDKLAVSVMDQDRALRYTIPYTLFDAESKDWRLEGNLMDRIMTNLGTTSPSPGKGLVIDR